MLVRDGCAGSLEEQRISGGFRRELPWTLPSPVNVSQRLRYAAIRWVTQWVARQIVEGDIDRKELSFRMVNHRDDWSDMRRLRLAVYAETIPYMLSVLDADGADEYDGRSIVFGLWYRRRAVATVRFTQWPFEVSRYLAPETHAEVLPGHLNQQTLEFSRLVVAPSTGLNRLMPALITYAGLVIVFSTNYRRYIGYAKATVVRKLAAFRCSTGHEPFSIPERGGHQYELVLGNFLIEVEGLIARSVRARWAARLVRSLFPRS